MKKLKLPLLYLISFALSIGPIAVFVFFNIDNYITSVEDAIKLSAGGVIAVILVLLKVLGKLKIPSRVSVLACIFLLSYLLNPILEDLAILSFLALLGEGLDTVFSILIKREKGHREKEKIAKATSDAIEKIIPRA